MLIDESHNGKTVDIPIGDTIEIRLPENASTGFRWNVTSRCESILAMTSDRREPPASSARGAPGQHQWQLQATAAGECDFELAYQRPWDGDVPPGRSFKLHVRVKR